MTHVRKHVMEMPVDERLDYALCLLETLVPSAHDARVIHVKEQFGVRPSEARLIVTMNERFGHPVTKLALYESLYATRPDGPDMKIIDVFICKIRATAPSLEIQTVWGKGYRLVGESKIEYPDTIEVQPVDVLDVPPSNGLRNCLPWEKQDDEDLRRMAERGDTWEVIAYELERTSRGCRDRWHVHLKGQKNA